MLSRRAFLKLSALHALAAVSGFPHTVLSRGLRVLLPTDAPVESLAALASAAGQVLQPRYYRDNPKPPLRHLTFDLVSVPAPLIPEQVRKGRLIRLPPLDLTSLGPNWASGRRPHDPENAYSLPRDWGYISSSGRRRSHSFRPHSRLVWGDDWAIPAGAGDPALAADFLSLWLASPQAAELASSQPPQRSLPRAIAFVERGEYEMPEKRSER